MGQEGGHGRSLLACPARTCGRPLQWVKVRFSSPRANLAIAGKKCTQQHDETSEGGVEGSQASLPKALCVPSPPN